MLTTSTHLDPREMSAEHLQSLIRAEGYPSHLPAVGDSYGSWTVNSVDMSYSNSEYSTCTIKCISSDFQGF